MAWILLSNASVLSLEDNMLTLRFARDGDLKGFSTSGCDADLKRVLSAEFGLNVMVKGVTGGDPGGPAAGRRPVTPRSRPSQKPRLSPATARARPTRMPVPARPRRARPTSTRRHQAWRPAAPRRAPA